MIIQKNLLNPFPVCGIVLCTGLQGFPGGGSGKEPTQKKNPPTNVGDLGSIPGLGRPPGRGHGKPLQYSCLENPHGQRSLVGSSPWDLKETGKTETITTHSGEQARHSPCSDET